MEENNFEKIEAIEIKEPSTNKKQEMKSKLPEYILLVSLSLGGGFTGSWLYNQINPPKTVYETVTKVEHTAVSSDNMSVQEVVAKVQNSVVQINVKSDSIGFLGQTFSQESAGSGVIITNDGYIVTNNHVIEGNSEISVTLNDGSIYEAKVVGNDEKSDLAVIKIEGNNFIAASFGNSSEIVIGDTAIAIGNPLGELGGTVTTGIISALDREINVENQAMNLLQTNAEINPGNSGGGLFNSKAELIGIVNAKTSATSIEGIGFAIPSNDAKDIIEQLIDKGYVSNRATLGVYTAELSQKYNDYEPGLYVSEVIEGSGAEKAGIKANDRIIKIDDTEISSYTDLSRILKKHKPNDTVEIIVIRDGNELKLNVTLTETIIDSKKN